jgi:hypothetical protein
MPSFSFDQDSTGKRVNKQRKYVIYEGVEKG